MHEIITLQLGQRANYLATHFWNIQESYFTYGEGEQSLVDHDVHFRAGVGADGTETFTPRTVIYDLKGGFGTLRKHNALYDLTHDGDDIQRIWDGKETIQRQPAIPQSEYQRSLDGGLPAPTLTSDTVRYWSDYNRVFYNPKSIIQLNDYELNSRTMPFEDWNVGEDLFQDLDKEHDVLDRDLRPFAEECDQIRALQLFTSSDDAWGGFSARYVDRIRDEFGKTSLWIWALENGTKVQRENRLKRDINLARSLSSIAPLSSLYVPIHDPPARIPKYLTVDCQSEWHTSALISSAVETVTLPSRLRQYHDFEGALAGDDGVHKIFELQSRVIQDGGHGTNGFAAKSEQVNGEDAGAKPQTRFDLNFSNEDVRSNEPHLFNQVEVSRGSRPQALDDEESGDPALVRRERFYSSEPMLQRFYVPMGFPLLDSAPRHMFPVTRLDEKGMSVVAALTASSRTGDSLRALQTTAQRIISIDERETIYNSLGEIHELYETGWNSGSDSDDD